MAAAEQGAVCNGGPSATRLSIGHVPASIDMYTLPRAQKGEEGQSLLLHCHGSFCADGAGDMGGAAAAAGERAYVFVVDASASTALHLQATITQGIQWGLRALGVPLDQQVKVVCLGGSCTGRVKMTPQTTVVQSLETLGQSTGLDAVAQAPQQSEDVTVTSSNTGVVAGAGAGAAAGSSTTTTPGLPTQTLEFTQASLQWFDDGDSTRARVSGYEDPTLAQLATATGLTAHACGAVSIEAALSELRLVLEEIPHTLPVSVCVILGSHTAIEDPFSMSAMTQAQRLRQETFERIMPTTVCLIHATVCVPVPVPVQPSNDEGAAATKATTIETAEATAATATALEGASMSADNGCGGCSSSDASAACSTSPPLPPFQKTPKAHSRWALACFALAASVAPGVSVQEVQFRGGGLQTSSQVNRAIHEGMDGQVAPVIQLQVIVQERTLQRGMVTVTKDWAVQRLPGDHGAAVGRTTVYVPCAGSLWVVLHGGRLRTGSLDNVYVSVICEDVRLGRRYVVLPPSQPAAPLKHEGPVLGFVNALDSVMHVLVAAAFYVRVPLLNVHWVTDLQLSLVQSQALLESMNGFFYETDDLEPTVDVVSSHAQRNAFRESDNTILLDLLSPVKSRALCAIRRVAAAFGSSILHVLAGIKAALHGACDVDADVQDGLAGTSSTGYFVGSLFPTWRQRQQNALEMRESIAGPGTASTLALLPSGVAASIKDASARAAATRALQVLAEHFAPQRLLASDAVAAAAAAAAAGSDATAAAAIATEAFPGIGAVTNFSVSAAWAASLSVGRVLATSPAPVPIAELLACLGGAGIVFTYASKQKVLDGMLQHMVPGAITRTSPWTFRVLDVCVRDELTFCQTVAGSEAAAARNDPRLRAMVAAARIPADLAPGVGEENNDAVCMGVAVVPGVVAVPSPGRGEQGAAPAASAFSSYSLYTEHALVRPLAMFHAARCVRGCPWLTHPADRAVVLTAVAWHLVQASMRTWELLAESEGYAAGWDASGCHPPVFDVLRAIVPCLRKELTHFVAGADGDRVQPATIEAALVSQAGVAQLLRDVGTCVASVTATLSSGQSPGVTTDAVSYNALVLKVVAVMLAQPVFRRRRMKPAVFIRAAMDVYAAGVHDAVGKYLLPLSKDAFVTALRSGKLRKEDAARHERQAARAALHHLLGIAPAHWAVTVLPLPTTDYDDEDDAGDSGSSSGTGSRANPYLPGHRGRVFPVATVPTLDVDACTARLVDFLEDVKRAVPECPDIRTHALALARACLCVGGVPYASVAKLELGMWELAAESNGLGKGADTPAGASTEEHAVGGIEDSRQIGSDARSRAFSLAVAELAVVVNALWRLCARPVPDPAANGVGGGNGGGGALDDANDPQFRRNGRGTQAGTALPNAWTRKHKGKHDCCEYALPESGEPSASLLPTPTPTTSPSSVKAASLVLPPLRDAAACMDFVRAVVIEEHKAAYTTLFRDRYTACTRVERARVIAKLLHAPTAETFYALMKHPETQHVNPALRIVKRGSQGFRTLQRLLARAPPGTLPAHAQKAWALLWRQTHDAQPLLSVLHALIGGRSLDPRASAVQVARVSEDMSSLEPPSCSIVTWLYSKMPRFPSADDAQTVDTSLTVADASSGGVAVTALPSCGCAPPSAEEIDALPAWVKVRFNNRLQQSRDVPNRHCHSTSRPSYSMLGHTTLQDYIGAATDAEVQHYVSAHRSCCGFDVPMFTARVLAYRRDFVKEEDALEAECAHLV